jgi:hypothetical protein
MKGNGFKSNAAWAPVNPAVPKLVTGMWLAHAKLSKAERAYIAADLYHGDTRLIEPTMLQSATLARVNVTYAHIAASRLADRLLVESGAVPLTPKSTVKALPAPVSVEARMASVIHDVGIQGERDLLSDLSTLMAIETMEQEQLAAAV